MIVILGSRHDVVATKLAASWPHAALCSTDDLVKPGWVWRHGQAASRRWVAGGRSIPDRDVTGVFVRRSAIYAEELRTTHPADRTFLAAETTAFLTFVLATTSARVVNPVIDGAFGEEVLQMERLFAAASSAGLSIRPAVISTELRPRRHPRMNEVEVAAGEVFGDAPPNVLDGTRLIAEALQLAWIVFFFDSRHRLITATTTRPPSAAAAAVLGQYLQTRLD